MSLSRLSPALNFKVRSCAERTREGELLRAHAESASTFEQLGADAQGKPTQVAPYRLQVTIETRRSDIRRFEGGAKRIRSLFGKAGLELIMSAWDVTPNGAQGGRESAEIFNLWELGGDADNLLKAMKYLGDTADYFRFEKLTFNEVKTLVLPLLDEHPFKLPEPPERELRPGRVLGARPGRASRYLYLKTTGMVRTPKIAEYRARLESGIRGFRERTGWELGDAYLGLTGAPNTITQLWLVTDDKTATINSRLASAPWDDLLDDEPQWRLLQPSSFDPIVQLESRRAWVK